MGPFSENSENYLHILNRPGAGKAVLQIFGKLFIIKTHSQTDDPPPKKTCLFASPLELGKWNLGKKHPPRSKLLIQNNLNIALLAQSLCQYKVEVWERVGFSMVMEWALWGAVTMSRLFIYVSV